MRYPTLDEWIQDLRSNPEKQSRNYLSSDLGDCCLGRLCLLAEIPFGQAKSVDQGGDRTTKLFNFSEWFPRAQLAEMYPPHQFLRYYGMNEFGYPLCEGTTSAHVGSLSWMNDTGYSFEQIADKLQEWKDAGLIHDPDPSFPNEKLVHVG